VTDAFTISVCAACGHAVFPPHLLCSVCGAGKWTAVAEPAATVEHVTVVRRRLTPDSVGEPVSIGVVRTSRGVRVVARLGDAVSAGDDVMLSIERGAVVGR
jgi:uncharacterized OB-fold protein